MTDPAVVAGLAARFRDQLDRDQLAGEVALAACQVGAQEIAAQFPDLDEIIACCRRSPGQACPFCDRGDGIHASDPQPVPQWAVEARQDRDAAEATLEAAALAMGDPGGIVALVAEPFGQAPPQQSLGAWLASLWRSDRPAFLRTYEVLRADPASQDAIAEAHGIIFGGPPGMVPAVPRLSHAVVRNALELEGHRDRYRGDGSPPPPPPAEPDEPRPRRRGRRW